MAQVAGGLIIFPPGPEAPPLIIFVEPLCQAPPVQVVPVLPSLITPGVVLPFGSGCCPG